MRPAPRWLAEGASGSKARLASILLDPVDPITSPRAFGPLRKKPWEVSPGATQKWNTPFRKHFVENTIGSSDSRCFIHSSNVGLSSAADYRQRPIYAEWYVQYKPQSIPETNTISSCLQISSFGWVLYISLPRPLMASKRESSASTFQAYTSSLTECFILNLKRSGTLVAHMFPVGNLLLSWRSEKVYKTPTWPEFWRDKPGSPLQDS